MISGYARSLKPQTTSHRPVVTFCDSVFDDDCASFASLVSERASTQNKPLCEWGGPKNTFLHPPGEYFFVNCFSKPVAQICCNLLHSVFRTWTIECAPIVTGETVLFNKHTKTGPLFSTPVAEHFSTRFNENCDCCNGCVAPHKVDRKCITGLMTNHSSIEKLLFLKKKQALKSYHFYVSRGGSGWPKGGQK